MVGRVGDGECPIAREVGRCDVRVFRASAAVAFVMAVSFPREGTGHTFMALRYPRCISISGPGCAFAGFPWRKLGIIRVPRRVFVSLAVLECFSSLIILYFICSFSRSLTRRQSQTAAVPSLGIGHCITIPPRRFGPTSNPLRTRPRDSSTEHYTTRHLRT